ncbi:MAG: helix-turn-helix transcriptional regulator [Bacteroidota bacterium]
MQEQIKSIRKLLGLSGRQLAKVLACSYSQIAMAESGKRDLPSPVVAACDTLHRYLLVEQQQAQPVKAIVAPGDPNWLRQWLRDARNDLNGAELKIANIDDAIGLIQKQLTSAGLLQQYIHTDPDSLEALEISFMARKATTELNRLASKKYPLALKIEGLRAQIALAETWESDMQAPGCKDEAIN